MGPDKVQRTLLIGLGLAGARAVELTLVALNRRLGEIAVIDGLAILADLPDGETPGLPVVVIAGAGVEDWPAEFEQQVEAGLRQISQVSHLARLNQQGLGLRYPDEVHLVIVADLAEAWAGASLAANLIDRLRQLVYQTLTCQTGATGVLLRSTGAESLNLPLAEPADDGHGWDWLAQFDRGCFGASLINEVGWVIGGADRLFEYTAEFLALLVPEALPAGYAGPDPVGLVGDCQLTSFGVAALHWPGRELNGLLSVRWSRAMLDQMLTPPPTGDLVQAARQAVQHWLVEIRLPPPALLDRLAVGLPPPPQHLPELVPEPPWPWDLAGIQARLEEAGQGWQTDWLSAGEASLQTVLNELVAVWPAEAELWLARQIGPAAGAVLRGESAMAALSELLQAFGEGVEANLEAAETDLIELDQQLGQIAGNLQAALASLPGSPAAALLTWGLRPWQWPAAWADCQQARTLARSLAHLIRGRLLAWQMMKLYEALLPFYQQLQAAWSQVVTVWEQGCREVDLAAQALAGTDLDLALSAPWTEAMVLKLYQTVVAEEQDSIWAATGELRDWVAAGLTGAEVEHRLRQATGQALEPALARPVDDAFSRQFPDPTAQTAYLAGMVEQARPFWRFDESSLPEESRALAQLQSWLLLPGGPASPLAALAQNWPRPPAIAASPGPESLLILTFRRITLSNDNSGGYDEAGKINPDLP
jgi:hypothetical protein